MKSKPAADKWFHVEVLRTQRVVWLVSAEDEEEAVERFEDGEASGPVHVENEGEKILGAEAVR